MKARITGGGSRRCDFFLASKKVNACMHGEECECFFFFFSTNACARDKRD